MSLGLCPDFGSGFMATAQGFGLLRHAMNSRRFVVQIYSRQDFESRCSVHCLGQFTRCGRTVSSSQESVEQQRIYYACRPSPADGHRASIVPDPLRSGSFASDLESP